LLGTARDGLLEQLLRLAIRALREQHAALVERDLSLLFVVARLRRRALAQPAGDDRTHLAAQVAGAVLHVGQHVLRLGGELEDRARGVAHVLEPVPRHGVGVDALGELEVRLLHQRRGRLSAQPEHGEVIAVTHGLEALLDELSHILDLRRRHPTSATD
jgi:hypothetical protein